MRFYVIIYYNILFFLLSLSFWLSHLPVVSRSYFQKQLDYRFTSISFECFLLCRLLLEFQEDLITLTIDEKYQTLLHHQRLMSMFYRCLCEEDVDRED